MMMNSRNWLPHAKRGWMLAGVVVIAAILLFLAAPPAHGAPCPHSQQGERPSTAQHEAVPDCCRGSRVVVPQCGRKSMAAGALAAGPLPCGASSFYTAFVPLRPRAAGITLPWTSYYERSMRVLR